jgi:hypothetical protein
MIIGSDARPVIGVACQGLGDGGQACFGDFDVVAPVAAADPDATDDVVARGDGDAAAKGDDPVDLGGNARRQGASSLMKSCQAWVVMPNPAAV